MDSSKEADYVSNRSVSETTVIKDFFDEQKKYWKTRARNIDFTKDIPVSTKQADVKSLLYRQAKQIDLKFQTERLLHNWPTVFYLLHIYLELTLKHSLHKPDPKEPKYTNQAATVFKNLERIPTRLEIAEKGMLWQLENARAKQIRDEEWRLEKKKYEEKQKYEEMENAWNALRMDASTQAAASSVETATLVSPPPPPSQQPTDTSYGISKTTAWSPDKVTNLVLKSVTGDGHCAFRAIAQGKAEGRLTPQAETTEALRLRRLAVELLMEKADQDMTGSGLQIKQVVLMSEDHETFQDYLDAMSKTNFAGETELWLLAGALKTPISVFRENELNELEHMITYGEQNALPGSGICLLWQRGKHSERGNHYDVMLKSSN